MSFSWFDILLLAVAVTATVVGLIKGLIREALGVFAALAGLILAANYYPNLSFLLRDVITPGQIRDFISFGTIFIVVLLLGVLLGRLLSRRIAGLSKFLDRILGGLFGLLKGAFFAGSSSWRLPSSLWIKRSSSGRGWLPPPCRSPTALSRSCPKS
jgi:membrane protein required for colicin V production